METKSKKLEFYGGEWMSFLPFITFIVLVVINTLYFRSISNGALWLPAFLGIIISFFFAKDKKHYSEVIISGMANRDAIIPIVCWIFAGVFSNVLKTSGLASGIAGVSASMGIKGVGFIVVSFVAAAIFATASGTGFGTIAMGMGVLYPAGLSLGCHPGLLAGAIISGGAFGDNLAPISDTTICSATSLGVDVPGVVKSRLKYALSAGLLTIIGIIVVGSGYSGEVLQGAGAIDFDGKTLFMLVPVVVTIYIAIKTGDIIIATITGIVLASVFSVGLGLVDFIQVDMINPTKEALFVVGGEGLDRSVDGILYSGINSMIQVIILALLLFGLIEVMKVGRGDEKLLAKLGQFVKTPRGGEFSISFMVIILSGLMGLNAPAILAVGSSFAKPISEKYGISPYRAANLLDAQSNTLVYSLPWTPAVVYTMGFAKDTLVPLSAVDIAPYVLYSYFMLIVMFITIIFGIGRYDNMERK